MALNDILTSMDGARDALVTAINAKGGSLADNATLYQCADAVTNIDSNPGTDTQEPVLLSPTNVTEETLALNTATNSYGTWTFSASNKASGYEPSALFMESYDNFTFGSESTHWLLVECTNTFAPESLYFYAGGSNVLGYTPKTLEIYGTSNGVEYLLGTATLVSTDQDANGLSNTVEATIGLDHGGRTYSSIKIIQTSNQTNTSVQAIWRKIEIRGYDTAVVTPCTAEYYKCASVDTEAKTWSGYKAVFDSGTGTWSFESGVTAGLAYTNVTPIVGGIYSADALVIVSLLYTGTPTLTSPTGMTSEGSDEWEISASSNYGAYYPWKAFDGITDPMTNCWTGNSGSSWWIQWQNKQKQVLVQRLKMTVADSLSQQAVLSFTLQGSDDGNTWTDIHSESGLSWTTNGESKEFTFANSKSYYYHRLSDITAPSFPTILELETYDM